MISKCTKEADSVSENLAIFKCYQGSEGNNLEYEAGVATQALEPALTSVPWVVGNSGVYD